MKQIIIMVLLAAASLPAQTFIIQDSTSSVIDIGDNYLTELILPDLSATSFTILVYDSLRSEYQPFYSEGIEYSIPLQNFTHVINFKPSVIFSLQGKIKLKFNVPETTEKIGQYRLRAK